MPGPRSYGRQVDWVDEELLEPTSKPPIWIPAFAGRSGLERETYDPAPISSAHPGECRGPDPMAARLIGWTKSSWRPPPSLPSGSRHSPGGADLSGRPTIQPRFLPLTPANAGAQIPWPRG